MSKFIQITDLNLKIDFDSIDDNEVKYYYFDKSLKPGTEIINTELVSEIIPITVKDCNEKHYKIYVDGVLKYINQQDFEKILGQVEESSKPQLNTIPRGNIPKKYNYIARNSSGHLYLFSEKPEKDGFSNFCWRSNGDVEIISPLCEEILGSTFENVQWYDAEPTEIVDNCVSGV